jgi:hypothetical protein
MPRITSDLVVAEIDFPKPFFGNNTGCHGVKGSKVNVSFGKCNGRDIAAPSAPATPSSPGRREREGARDDEVQQT